MKVCCSAPTLVNEKSDQVCRNCGVVSEDAYILPVQFNTVGYMKHPNANTFHSNNLFTRIAGKSTRMMTYHRNSSGNSRDYCLEKLCQVVKNKLGVHNVPECIVDACLYEFREVNTTTSIGRRNSFKGRVKDGLIATCLFQAYREQGCERNWKVLCHWLGLNTKDFSRCFEKYIELKLDILNTNNVLEIVRPFDPNAVIQTQCNLMGIPLDPQYLVMRLHLSVKRSGMLETHTPYTVIDSLIYYVVTHPDFEADALASEETMEAVCTTSIQTMKNICKFLLINDELLEYGMHQ